MENPINNLITNITNHFVNEPPIENNRNISTLIRIHNEKLAQTGDISFPGKPEIWKKYFQEPNKQLNEQAFELLNDNQELAENEKKQFLETAKEWSYPVVRLDIRHERIHMYLQRSAVIRSLIPEVLMTPNYGQLRKAVNRNVFLNPLAVNALYDEDLSLYRSKLMYNALQKLLVYSRWNVVEDKSLADNKYLVELNVQSVAGKVVKDLQYSGVAIKCGLVTDPSNKGKLCQISTKDYLR